MPDPTTRHSTHPRKRRPHVKLERRRNGFARVIAAFNRTLNEHFPLTPYRDSMGRSRVSGRARRARAATVLRVLAEHQTRCRSGIVYLGYEALAAAMHCSRSTAYRGVKDLRATQQLGCQAGGGKTYNELGQLVEAANGYLVPDHLAGPAERRPRKPRGGHPKKREVSSRGQQMTEEMLERRERWKAARAGPAP